MAGRDKWAAWSCDQIASAQMKGLGSRGKRWTWGNPCHVEAAQNGPGSGRQPSTVTTAAAEKPQGEVKLPRARRLATRPNRPDRRSPGRGSALPGRVRSYMLLNRPDFRRPGPGKGSRGASQARCLGAGRGGLGLFKGRDAALETE